MNEFTKLPKSTFWPGKGRKTTHDYGDGLHKTVMAQDGGASEDTLWVMCANHSLGAGLDELLLVDAG